MGKIVIFLILCFGLKGVIAADNQLLPCPAGTVRAINSKCLGVKGTSHELAPTIWLMPGERMVFGSDCVHDRYDRWSVRATCTVNQVAIAGIDGLVRLEPGPVTSTEILFPHGMVFTLGIGSMLLSMGLYYVYHRNRRSRGVASSFSAVFAYLATAFPGSTLFLSIPAPFTTAITTALVVATLLPIAAARVVSTSYKRMYWFASSSYILIMVGVYLV